MEEYSLTSKEETGSDKPVRDKKTKKRAEALGAFLVEPKTEEAQQGKSARDALQDLWLPRTQRRDKQSRKERDQEMPEAEVALDDLSPEEEASVNSLTAEAQLAALHESPAENNPETVYGDLLVEDFLEQVAHAAAPAEAMQNTLSKAGIESVGSNALAEESVALPEQEYIAFTEVAGRELADNELHEFTEYEAEIYLREPENTSQQARDEQVATGSGGEPPMPPRRPTAAAGGDHSRRPEWPVKDRMPPGYDGALYGKLPRRLRTEYLSSHNEFSLLDAALVGGTAGIVGYLMGRRRGRIKAEKKLAPIQKRLEKQVKSLQGELQARETKLRKVAAEHVRSRGPALIERFKEAAPRPSKERAETVSQPYRPQTPEARQLHAEQRAPERLGHIVVVAEASSVTAREAERHTQTVAERQVGSEETTARTDKSVATMNRAELLNLSEKIIIDGASLRQIYETRLVGERGLRRLVGEHLRGGNVKKMLQREIIEREIDFERDPAMRDRAAQTGDSGDGGTSPSLKDILDRVGANKTGSDEEAAFYKARAAYDARERSAQREQRRMMDISMAATITVLLVAVMILLLTR